MMLNTCSLNIQGNISFVGNKALYHGGAMLLQNTNSNVNGNLFLNKNLASFGGALSIKGGNFIIRGYTLFNSNHANSSGGALYIGSHANFIFCGFRSVYSEGNNVSFEAGALLLNKAKACDAEYSTDNALPYVIFLRNAARYDGGSITCGNASITFIGTVFFNESFGGAVKGYSCNIISFVGTTCFHGNSASYAGGIMSTNSNIMLSGTAYFERNVANYYSGGAIALSYSKLIFKPNLNIFFISNYANEADGALHITDSQCSLGSSEPLECFITIDDPSNSTSNISLHFENNSAGFTGSILYGGQLDQCRLFFKSTTTDLCDCQAHSYSDNALKLFMNMSNITQNEVPNNNNNIFNSEGNQIL